jgi:hypothetical protein
VHLLLRHSRNMSHDVYRAAAAHVSAILFAASHSTVAWLPSTVVNKHFDCCVMSVAVQRPSFVDCSCTACTSQYFRVTKR